MIVLWLTREFGDIRGWNIIFREGYLKCFISSSLNSSEVSFFDSYLSDSTVAVFSGILPLIVPNSNPFKSMLEKRILSGI